ncbi:Lipase (class 3) [Novymonas esmeraldas]|uniref:Lipase (Class 3) n=1 Tax=Novymonas esmeraldas TaxID=1808958 RepID=A0AAW0EWL3_9TRYP
MSLRLESIRAYRELHRAASRSSQACALYNSAGLLSYVSQRFGEEAETHSSQLSSAMRALEQRSGDGGSKRFRGAMLKRAQSKLLQQYQRHISIEIDRTRAMAQALYLAPENAQLTSVLQVLSAGVGNQSYQRMVESSILAFVEHDEKKTARDEVTEDVTSERQNRIMLQALLPYAERLLLVHRTAIGEQNRESALVYLTPWQVTEAIVGNRSGVSAVHLRVGRDHLVVEVDETYNKQVVYVCCTRQDSGDSGSYEWAQEVERVEISESEDVQKTLFHSDYLLMATRICDTLLHDSPLHPTRSTVVIGHAVGGAVGLVLSLLLAQRGFTLANTVSLGAPKSLQGTLERFVAAVNPIRVVLAGDPLVELPVTGAEGAPFVHIGEILLVSPAGAPRNTSPLTKAPQPNDDGKPTDSESSARTTDALSAESLSAMMLDTADEAAREQCTTLESSPAEPRGTILNEPHEEEEDATEALAVAEKRYRNQFLVEHYVQHLQDPTVELTYAEGDEVWDDGDYEEMRRATSREPLVTAEERRIRDLRGPL